MLTLFKLYIESRQYARSDTGSTWSIFKTLIRLYFKSKFSTAPNEIVKHKIHAFTFYSYNYPVLIELYREIFLKEVYKSESLSDAPFIIDCGANIGFSVLFFKQHRPNAEIWAFEPNLHSFFLLEKNIRENNIQGVKLFNCALGDTNGITEFYVPQNKSSLNGSSVETDCLSDKIMVQTKKLSDLITGKTVDLIKIDIEGDEIKVIQDLDESRLLLSVQECIIEYHHATEKSLHSFVNFLGWFEKSDFKYAFRSVEDAGKDKQNVVIKFKRG